jgi:hypothetical protein
MNSTKFVFLFFPYHNTGGHFIIWSLYFLSGQAQHLVGDNQIIDCVVDPDTTAKNFHQQKVLMSCGFEDTKEKYSKAVNFNSELPVVFFYIKVMSTNEVLKKMFAITIVEANAAQQQLAIDYIFEDTKKLVAWVQQHDFPLVQVEYNLNDLLNITYNDRYPSGLDGASTGSINTTWEIYKKTFFAGIDDKFNNTTWDNREKLALIFYNYTPHGLLYSSAINKKLPHLLYTTDDVWNDLFSVVNEILHFIDISISSTRISQWQLIYNDWRLKHDQYFSRHFDRIINAIVHNEYLSLERFNLDFYKEVIIQNALLYKHNLNLKNWQLEKFPANTQDLHKLLEPNIHQLIKKD